MIWNTLHAFKAIYFPECVLSNELAGLTSDICYVRVIVSCIPGTSYKEQKTSSWIFNYSRPGLGKFFILSTRIPSAYFLNFCCWIYCRVPWFHLGTLTPLFLPLLLVKPMWHFSNYDEHQISPLCLFARTPGFVSFISFPFGFSEVICH